jgi:exodeoxyribonuclease V gamma subunit
MGAYGRDFIARLHDLEGEEFSLAQPPQTRCLLSLIQSDILHLQQRGQQEEAPIQSIAPDDASLQIHSCHGPLREIEVLYDNLLRQFDTIAGLSPSDIVVMAPDIELYAPYIHAVFGAVENEFLRMPYSITDRGAESPVITVFLSLLSAAQSRFTSSEILSLLEERPVLDAFSIAESDLNVIRSWVNETHIRWGLDEAMREAFDVPGFSENTWKSGISEILLGYAMNGHTRLPFKGIIPYEAVEAASTDLIAHFLDFIGYLADLRLALLTSRPLEDWTRVLLGFLTPFLIENEYNAPTLKILRDAITELKLGAQDGGFTDVVDAETILSRLDRTLRSVSVSGFISGGVTFCEMLPMRSIPFQSVCLLGMNDTAFPRRTRSAGWDLMARNPQRGDRSLEKEDRYIFLEALLSARAIFYISYEGKDGKDNSLRQPSVVVSELLDYINQGFTPATNLPGNADKSTPIAQTAADVVMYHHRLQAFSPRYFNSTDRIFSYSEENCRAAERESNPDAAPLFFFPTPLDAPSEEWLTVEIADLCAFFVHPIKFLLSKRLEIHIPDIAESASDKEPFFIQGIDGYNLGQELVGRLLRKESRGSCFESMKAASLLPHGTAGVCAFAALASEASLFVERITSAGFAGNPTSIRVEGAVGRYALSGTIEQYGRSGLFLYRFADVKPKDMLHFWIQSCALSALSCAPGEGNVLLARNGGWRLPRIDNAQAMLQALLDTYWEGLRFPLHFFPKSSWGYVEDILKKNKPPDYAMRSANKIWLGDEFSEGEILDPYYALCFSKTPEDPLDDDFRRVSMAILKPLFDSIEEL